MIRISKGRIKKIINNYLYRTNLKENDIVLPSHSRKLPSSDLKKALKICDWIKAIVDDRKSYIERNGLNAEINNPGANWDLNNPIYNGFYALLSKKEDHINNLRFFSQIYSGHFMGLVNSGITPLPVPDSLRPDLDEYIKGLVIEHNAMWVSRYKKMLPELADLQYLGPPHMFAESGSYINNIIVSADTCAYLERIALMNKGGIFEKLRNIKSKGRNPRILEIGSGYGALAYYIKQIIPTAEYVCVDLPESLIFSGIYLTGTLHQDKVEGYNPDKNKKCSLEGVNLVPNYMFSDFVKKYDSFDLAINTLSMSEMTEAQVRAYCEGLKKLLNEDGLFFEQNQNNKHLGFLDAQDVIAEYFTLKDRPDLPSVGKTQGSVNIWKKKN